MTILPFRKTNTPETRNAPEHPRKPLIPPGARPTIFPQTDPADPALVEKWGAARCLRTRLLPWRRVGQQVIILTPDAGAFERHEHVLRDIFGPVRMARCTDHQIKQAVQSIADHTLSHAAETRTEPRKSVRQIKMPLVQKITGVLFVILALSFWFFPAISFAILSGIAVVACILVAMMKLMAAFSQPKLQTPKASDAPLPHISILVPLRHEDRITSRLLDGLKQLRYPRHLLEICLIVERDDLLTQIALERTPLPPWLSVITVPDGTCQTKPRALNYALDFVHGQIIGVYDAEDIPDPDQLDHVVRHFAHAPNDVACVQGVLDFYNVGHSWLSRCFALEYATWFRMVLPGLQGLGLVIPLGGTTLFFRRDILENLGRWDAHNVTEDADLGVRLARHGYRTEIIPSTTREEANANLRAWVKQRSRWIKGYALTYWVHMQNPMQLWRDLGTWRFFWFQVQFGGTLTTSILAPVLWSFWLAILGFPHPFIAAIGANGVFFITAFFLLAELLNLSLAMIAAAQAGHRRLIKWSPTLHVYFPLAAIAAYKALWEIVTRPFYWDKTDHGGFSS